MSVRPADNVFRLAVVVRAAHPPALQVEAALSAAIQTDAVGLTLRREGPTYVPVPAPEQLNEQPRQGRQQVELLSAPARVFLFEDGFCGFNAHFHNY